MYTGHLPTCSIYSLQSEKRLLYSGKKRIPQKYRELTLLEENSRIGIVESVHEYNAKCNNFHVPSTKAVFCFPSEPFIPEGPECEKISTLYRCT